MLRPLIVSIKTKDMICCLLPPPLPRPLRQRLLHLPPAAPPSASLPGGSFFSCVCVFLYVFPYFFFFSFGSPFLWFFCRGSFFFICQTSSFPAVPHFFPSFINPIFSDLLLSTFIIPFSLSFVFFCYFFFSHFVKKKKMLLIHLRRFL